MAGSEPEACSARSIALFAKLPRPGQVKTRLVPPLTSEQAARVARAFLLDTAELVGRCGAERRVVYHSPDGAAEEIRQLVGSAFELVPQGGGDLGTRLERATEREFERGCDALVLVGSDSPSLPAEILEEAFGKLRSSDVVIGPSFDLGYYLLALRQPTPTLFRGICWGTADVLPATLGAIRRGGLRLELLPPWRDVDDYDDLRFLRAHLDGLRLAGQRLPAATVRCLEEVL